MTTLIHFAGALEALAAGAAAIWAAAGELVTAGALLLALDRLASLIRSTYAAGRAVGTLWFRYGQPALLAAADGISWLLAQIDWAEVRAVGLAAGRAALALVITVAAALHAGLIAVSAAMGHRYAALLAPAAPAALPPTVRGLRALARERGIPAKRWKSARKAELQLLLAC